MGVWTYGIRRRFGPVRHKLSRDGNGDLDAIVHRIAGVFGVNPWYFLDWGEGPPVLDREALEIFRDESTSAMARKSFRLPGHEKRMILNIIDELENTRCAADR